MKYYPLPYLRLLYRPVPPLLPPVEEQLDALHRFASVLSPSSPLLRVEDWLLAGTTEEDSTRYAAFKNGAPSTELMAVLREKTRGVADLRFITLWNGAEADEEAASLGSRCYASPHTLPNEVTLELGLRPEVLDWKTPAHWIQEAAKIWPLTLASFAPFYHNEHVVFKDRPGVGWMLYLPTVLTEKQVPEARALEPVTNEDGKQIGTLIVSVTDAPYSDANPEHVKAANSIEVRLADQDLLPRSGS